LDADGAKRFADANGLAVDGLHDAATLTAAIQTHLDESVNPQFSRVEYVRKFVVLGAEFAIDKGELTPTMKVKRNKVNENYAGIIDAMYED
jgi:long-chain acyl-CoA synthetase